MNPVPRCPAAPLSVSLALLMLLAACGEDGPPAEVRVTEARDLGVLETSPHIRGRDGGYSGLFEGRSVWLYGDTILGTPDADGRTWLHNSWSFTEDLDLAGGITSFREAPRGGGHPTEFFPWTDEEWAFNEAHAGDPCQAQPCGARWALWPGPLVADPARSRALVFYGKIYAEPGDFNFHSVGQSLAVWERFDELPRRPLLRPGTPEPTLLFDRDEPAFGSAAVVEGEMLHAYGCGSSGSSKPCFLGRVPLADALERDEWRFYAGERGWLPELDVAKPVFEGNDILSVAYVPFLGRFLAVYAPPLENEVRLRTAPRPEGPWSRSVKAFETRPPEGDGWTYDAVAHEEYAQDGGRVQVITYSRATAPFASEVRIVSITLAADAGRGD